MLHRIEVATKEGFTDAAGRAVQRRARELGLPVEDVRTIDVYTIDGDLSPGEIVRLESELFTDPVTQTTSPPRDDFSYAIEVGFRPGVTDNAGRTASEAIGSVLGRRYPVYTSRRYVLRGAVSRSDAEHIASSLANSLIERIDIRDSGDFPVYVPAVRLQHEPAVSYIDLDVGDERLMQISKKNTLALNLEEMRAVRDHFRSLGRKPTDAELETLAQTWSEHCKHKIFSGEIEYTNYRVTERIDSLFDTFIRRPTEDIRRKLGKDDWLVSVFSDNAGVVKLGKYNIVFKVETHNSPSALDPYGGALTGIVGVNRDPLGTGLGARLLANTDVFCFADPEYRGELPSRIRHPARVFEGVRKGVEHGGNKSGIPTVNGTVRFDSYPFGSVRENGTIISYMGKPLVYCGTVGIMPAYIRGRPSHEKKANLGDAVVLAGGRTGKDGIHGATFSSEGLSGSSPATAVQIGDPITQKRMADMLLEARDIGLYTSITDNGAGGLACSVGEMARESGGAVLELERVPLKYEGLQPWEILLSEAQERMTLAVPQENVGRLLELARRRNVEATVIGKYTNDGRFRATYNHNIVSDLDMEFLHNGVPKKVMKAEWQPAGYLEPDFEEPDIGWALKGLLGRLNVCSKEYVVRQYDHEVQAGTVVKPLTGVNSDGPSDAAVVWPAEMREGFTGIVLSNGINPNYGLIDTYHMAASNIDEAIRNAVAVGADPGRIALLDNFCWSSSEDPRRLGQLVRACKALGYYARQFGTPFISGKDSMFNDYIGQLEGQDVKISVPPTLLISALGLVPDVRKAVTMDVKEPGNILYIVGGTYRELGGSEYYAMMGEQHGSAFIGRSVPRVIADRAGQQYASLHSAIMDELVASCHDCSDGGLGVALAEMAFAGGYGLDVDLGKVPSGKASMRNDYLLFSESNSRLLAEVPHRYHREFERRMSVPYARLSAIGSVASHDYLKLRDLSGRELPPMHIQDLKDSWQGTIA